MREYLESRSAITFNPSSVEGERKRKRAQPEEKNLLLKMKLGYALNVAGNTKSEKIRNQLVKALRILTTEHEYVKSLKAREQ